MSRSDFILAVLSALAYIVLIRFLVSISLTWGDAISDDNFWRQSTAAAVAYMQIYHSAGVLLAAFPPGLVIAWRYGVNWLRPAAIVAIVGSSYMLFDQLRGLWLLSQHGLAPETYGLVSGAIDVVKVGLIFLLVTAILRRIFMLKRATI